MTSTAWAWIALTVYLVGLALAFGLRTWGHWRSTGRTGFRGISGRPGSPAWFGGVLFPAALVLGLAAPPLVITGGTEPIELLTDPAVPVTGLVLTIAGLALVLAAQQAMGTSWRIGVDDTETTELVEDGLFSRVRNPIFTGMAAVSLGVALMVPTAVAALALVLLVAALQLQVRAVEEPYLRRVHGDAYARYTRRSGRFLPKLVGVRNHPTSKDR